MSIFLFLLAATQAAPAQTAPPAATPTARLGRGFLSPMGEPFFGRRVGEDGLVVWFAGADADHDGSLTADEMAADAERFFKVLDVDQDGEIGPDEIERYETQIAPQVRVRAAMENTRTGGNGTAETNAGRYGLLQIPEPVITADTNFNRGVSLDEFRQAAISRFQLLDTSRTGRLSLSQLQSIRQSALAASIRGVQKPQEAGEITQDSGAGADTSRPTPQY